MSIENFCCVCAKGDAFTLEKIIEIGLDQFSDVVGEISSAASKELAIEQAILSIAEQWKDLCLDVAAYKDRGHFRLRATDELFQVILMPHFIAQDPVHNNGKRLHNYYKSSLEGSTELKFAPKCSCRKPWTIVRRFTQISLSLPRSC